MFESQSVHLLSRRKALLSSLSLLAVSTLTGCARESDASTKVVHIGYQVAGDLARESKVIDRRLATLGVKTEWAQFVNGPPLLEALNAGAIDLGSTGETPPIFAQIAGADLVYLVNIPASTSSAYILITPKNSAIRTVADLKGKKIAYPRGTAATYYLAQVLKEAGLNFDDVQQVTVQISDYSGALQRGEIDGFVTVELYLERGGLDKLVRIIRDSKGISTPGSYFLANRKFAVENPVILKAILEEYYKTGLWRNAHPREAAKILASQLNLRVERLEKYYSKYRYTMEPMNEKIINDQQKIADFLYDIKVIPKKVNIRDAILTPEQYAAITPDAIIKSA